METNRHRGGIQQLLAAEQEAQQIVDAARSAKMARLKQAKEEAEKEVAEYRAQMELEFQRKVTESSGDSGANVKRLDQETDAKIHHLKTGAGKISQDVDLMLSKHVTTIFLMVKLCCVYHLFRILAGNVEARLFFHGEYCDISLMVTRVSPSSLLCW